MPRRPSPDIMNASQSAAYLGVTVAMLKVYVRGRRRPKADGTLSKEFGGLQPFAILPHDMLFRKADLDAYRLIHPRNPIKQVARTGKRKP